MSTTEIRINNSMDAAIASEFAEPLATSEVAADDRLDLASNEIPQLEIVGGVAFLKNDAELPTEACVKSGRKAAKVIEKSLRNPFNPTTWFGRRTKIRVGLSKRHYENFLVANALTWSGVGVGALLTVAGILAVSPLSIIGGLLLGFGMGVWRAFFPVWAKPGEEEGEVEVHGLSLDYLRHIDKK